MQFVATSMLSRSSSLRVPSVREVLRNSMMARASLCLVVAMVAGCIRGGVVWFYLGVEVELLGGCLESSSPVHSAGMRCG